MTGVGSAKTYLDALAVSLVGMGEVVYGVIVILLVGASFFGDAFLDLADLWVLGEGVGLCEERHGGSRMVLGSSTIYVVLGDAVEDVLCTRVEARFIARSEGERRHGGCFDRGRSWTRTMNAILGALCFVMMSLMGTALGAGPREDRATVGERGRMAGDQGNGPGVGRGGPRW